MRTSLTSDRVLSLVVVDCYTSAYVGARVVEELQSSFCHLPEDPAVPEFMGGQFIRRGGVDCAWLRRVWYPVAI